MLHKEGSAHPAGGGLTVTLENGSEQGGEGTEWLSLPKRKTRKEPELEPESVEVPPSSLPCKFFILGACSAGKSCRYVHRRSPTESIRLPCSYYLKGMCKFGDRCVLEHSKPSTDTKGHRLDHPAALFPFSNPWTAPIEPEGETKPLSYDRSLFDDPEADVLAGPLDWEAEILSFSSPAGTSSADTNGVNMSGAETAGMGLVPRSIHHVLECVDQGVCDVPGPHTYYPGSESRLSYSNAAKKSISGHDGGSGAMSISAEDLEADLCAFAKMGSCRYGQKCRYLHGDKCQFCNLYILHPSNADLRRLHLESCGHDQTLALEGSVPDESGLVECGICYEVISEKGSDCRLGLLNCDHPFCLECIRSWRASQNLDPAVVRSCPICRIVTHFITPSLIWTTDRNTKTQIIEEYKTKLR